MDIISNEKKKDLNREKVENNSFINKTLEYIELNLCSIKDYNEVARHVGISGHSLNESFKALIGYTVTEYIRNRRLYEAAIELVQTGANILNLSMKYGFESPDSFTRAFKKFHGRKPSKVKKNKGGYKKFLPIEVECVIKGGQEKKYRILQKYELRFLGYIRNIEKDDEENEIRNFWNDYYNKIDYYEKSSSPLWNIIKIHSIGEYGIRLNDYGSNFDYMIAGRYSGGDVPPEMSLKIIPENKWAIFDYYGYRSFEMIGSGVISESIREIDNSSNLERLDTSVIEWYDDLGRNKQNSRKYIWIPVKCIEKNDCLSSERETENHNSIVTMVKFSVGIIMIMLFMINMRYYNVDEEVLDEQSSVYSLDEYELDGGKSFDKSVISYILEINGIEYKSTNESDNESGMLYLVPEDKIGYKCVTIIEGGEMSYIYRKVYRIKKFDDQIAVLVDLGNNDKLTVFINSKYKLSDYMNIIYSKE